MAGVVQPLHRHSGSEAAVPDDGDDVVVLALEIAGGGHAEGGRDRGSSMRHVQRVVLAFPPVGETRDAAPLAKRLEAVAPPGQYLMPVCLVAHVEDQLVAGGVVEIVKRYDELGGAHRCAQVPPRFGGHLDDHVPDFADDLGKFFLAQFLEIFRAVNPV